MISMIRFKSQKSKKALRPIYEHHLRLSDLVRDPKYSISQKQVVLSEQLILARYLDLVGSKSDASSIRKHVGDAILALDSLVKLDTTADSTHWATQAMLSHEIFDHTNVNNLNGLMRVVELDAQKKDTVVQAPQSFYSPFHFTMSNGMLPVGLEKDPDADAYRTYSPTLLSPIPYRRKGTAALDCKLIAFPFYTYHQRGLGLFKTSFEKYLAGFDWSSKRFGDIVATLAALGTTSDRNTMARTAQVGLLHMGDRKLQGHRNEVQEILRFSSTLGSFYNMHFTDTERAAHWLSKFDSGIDEAAIDYMQKDASHATLGMKTSFSKAVELSFLKPFVEASHAFYGKEAAGDDASDSQSGDNMPSVEDDDDEASDDTEDTVEDDQDTSSDDETDDTEDEGASDPSEEGGTDDPDLGDDTGGDDAGEPASDPMGDTGGSSGDPNAQDNDVQPEDPSVLQIRILVENPSISVINYRRKMASLLRAFIANPPENTSANVIAEVKVWLTQWLYCATPETTNRFLALHALKLSPLVV